LTLNFLTIGSSPGTAVSAGDIATRANEQRPVQRKQKQRDAQGLGDWTPTPHALVQKRAKQISSNLQYQKHAPSLTQQAEHR
jgi:peptidase E